LKSVFKFINIKKVKILFFFLILFSIYCSILVGQTWDEYFHFSQGKITLNYLFSLGRIDKELFYREFYSPIYWSLQYLITKIFTNSYQAEVAHLINLTFSLSAIIGIGKLGKELFNKKVGKIIILTLFFYPVFFGHMSFNPKDTILAFSHIWIFVLSLKYLKYQSVKNNSNKYILFIALLASLSTGIQLVFLGSLLPIFLFVLVDIFFTKKFISTEFNNKKFFYDLIKCFIFFYIILIIFWIDTHKNIFILPINIILETFSANFWSGYPYNLVNGNYYLSNEIPKSYWIINFIYKTPEYLLISYVYFIFLLFNSMQFFVKKFKFFKYKLLLLTVILIFPNFILFINPYPLYDGMRLMLWALPYYCIIPSLTIYYLIENINLKKSKIATIFLLPFFIYFLFIFFSITPYQYTYLNLLNGKNENRYQKFEGDYWGASIKELIKNSDFNKEKIIKFATCGVNHEVSKKYFKKNGYFNMDFTSPENAEYIIMTNRVISKENRNESFPLLTNCFDKFKGYDVFKIQINNLLLSTIRKIN